ncbi:MAG TPA: alpha/beta hydrolase [Bryobacteraceae bacterium]|nr:alpha/beta hydrolase [Bryobacteraceae bacterium]
MEAQVASLHVEMIAGRKSGPTLVFLHHGLGCCALWRDYPAKLAAASGLPALVYDRLGHGRSPAAEGPRGPRYLQQEAAALADLLCARGVRDCILIGHSDGGSIALLAPVAARGIITEAAHLFVEPVTRRGIRKTVDLYHQGLRERLFRYHGAKTDTLFWEWAGCWLAPSFDTFDIRADVRNPRCPVLALQGADDEYGTVAQLEAIAANCGGPVETLVLPDCGHEPHQQAFNPTFEAMLRAIKE